MTIAAYIPITFLLLLILLFIVGVPWWGGGDAWKQRPAAMLGIALVLFACFVLTHWLLM